MGSNTIECREILSFDPNRLMPTSGDYSSLGQNRLMATQCADRFHVVKNFTEATQLLLARCHAEILETLKTKEANPNEHMKTVVSIEECMLCDRSAHISPAP